MPWCVPPPPRGGWWGTPGGGGVGSGVGGVCPLVGCGVSGWCVVRCPGGGWYPPVTVARCVGLGVRVRGQSMLLLSMLRSSRASSTVRFPSVLDGVGWSVGGAYSLGRGMAVLPCGPRCAAPAPPCPGPRCLARGSVCARGCAPPLLVGVGPCLGWGFHCAPPPCC